MSGEVTADCRCIATAINLGKKTNQIVRQNIGLAFGVKALVLGLGPFG